MTWFSLMVSWCSHNPKYLFYQLQKTEVRLENVFFLLPVSLSWGNTRGSIWSVGFIGLDNLEIYLGVCLKMTRHSSFVLWLIVGHSLHTGMSTAYHGKTTHHFTASWCSNCIGLILYHPSTGKNYPLFRSAI